MNSLTQSIPPRARRLVRRPDPEYRRYRRRTLGRLAFAAAVALVPSLVGPARLSAQDTDPSRKAITRMLNDAGRALGARNATRFLSYFDKQSVSEYARLETHVSALTEQADIASSLRITNLEPVEGGYRATIDWILQLTLVGAPGRVESRRASVRIAVVQAGKSKVHWKLSALDPIDFFRPL